MDKEENMICIHTRWKRSENVQHNNMTGSAGIPNKWSKSNRGKQKRHIVSYVGSKLSKTKLTNKTNETDKNAENKQVYLPEEKRS